MANAIASAGYRVMAWTRSQRRPEELSGSVDFRLSLADVAEHANAIIVMLADDRATDAVLFETGLAGMSPTGKLIIDMGTSGPGAAARHCNQLEKRGCAYIDAPVSGGVAGAKSAGLTIFAGASFENYRRAAPLLGTMGVSHHLGPVGAGQSAKLANQIIVATAIAALAEGLTFAQAQGIDADRFLRALEGGFADSVVLRQHGVRMVRRNFSEGGAMRLHLKDLRLAQTLDEALFARLRHARNALEVFAGLVADGMGDLDHSGYIIEYDRGDARMDKETRGER